MFRAQMRTVSGLLHHISSTTNIMAPAEDLSVPIRRSPLHGSLLLFVFGARLGKSTRGSHFLSASRGRCFVSDTSKYRAEGARHTGLKASKNIAEFETTCVIQERPNHLLSNHFFRLQPSPAALISFFKVFFA